MPNNAELILSLRRIATELSELADQMVRSEEEEVEAKGEERIEELKECLELHKKQHTPDLAVCWLCEQWQEELNALTF